MSTRDEPDLPDGTCCGFIIVFVLCLAGSICLGIGSDSLRHGRNTGAIGVVSSQSVQVTGFNTCQVNVTFESHEGARREALIIVPCLHDVDFHDQAIPVCYNRQNPNLVAYDDPTKEKGSKFENFDSLCSTVGYSEAVRLVTAGFVLLSVGLSALLLWSAYKSFRWFQHRKYKPLPVHETNMTALS